MKILVVDDDADLLSLIAFALNQAGYSVVRATDAPVALRVFEAEAPDLAILDINLPTGSGFEVCREIRRRSRVPVMMLTVRGEEADLVRALEIGADDYLTKPFSPRTLLARIKALLRRAGMETGGPMTAGPLSLDLEGLALRIGAAPPVRLTKLEARLLQILMAVMMGVFMTMMIPRAVVCAERIRELLETESSLSFPSAETAPTPTSGRVEFRGVTFGFPGAEKPVIENVSFVAEAGKTTAIIGSTGSGKTTLLNLILRLYDPQEGSITVDGAPVSALTRAQLARTLSLVPQRPYLFSGTIGSNLRFGRPEASDEELWEALRVAQGDDFVRAKELQLDEPMAQGGTSVSGGQRQRLSIARALVARPRVYLFDDSFSALDVATDARLRAALPQATEGATTIIVAQRVSTITGADQILVIEDGRIAGRGTHAELLETNEVYREIVRSQLEEAEAA